MDQPNQPPERRLEPRATKLSNHRVEFKFAGVPVYQFKVRDLSSIGTGIVVRADSKFLKMVQIGQELVVKLISPSETGHLTGHYRSTIVHISELKEGRFKGHMAVGISILSKVR
jgi:hypothetical protein